MSGAGRLLVSRVAFAPLDSQLAKNSSALGQLRPSRVAGRDRSYPATGHLGSLKGGLDLADRITEGIVTRRAETRGLPGLGVQARSARAQSLTGEAGRAQSSRLSKAGPGRSRLCELRTGAGRGCRQVAVHPR